MNFIGKGEETLLMRHARCLILKPFSRNSVCWQQFEDNVEKNWKSCCNGCNFLQPKRFEVLPSWIDRDTIQTVWLNIQTLYQWSCFCPWFISVLNFSNLMFSAAKTSWLVWNIPPHCCYRPMSIYERKERVVFLRWKSFEKGEGFCIH